MCEHKNNSLDDLFDDADQGICSNIVNGNDSGLVSLNEGLTILTHSLDDSGVNVKTIEKK